MVAKCQYIIYGGNKLIFMKNVLTVLALLLSITVYAGKEKKATKQKQLQPVEQQPVQQADTVIKDKASSYWEQDPRLGRRLYVSPSGTTK